jgi:hypothetical protein
MWRLLAQEETEGPRPRTGGSAQAADLEVFKTSSGNIVYELDNGELDCFVKSELKPAPRRNDVCHIGDSTYNRVNCLPAALPRRCSVPAIQGR